MTNTHITNRMNNNSFSFNNIAGGTRVTRDNPNWMMNRIIAVFATIAIVAPVIAIGTII